jgi:(R,R)-butanediol dehydrogenase/meso-butanediol dehydrogenase/diacetyl reductase
MQGLVYYGRNDIRYEDFPLSAQVGPREVKLQVKYAGICHTDYTEITKGPIYISATPHPRTGRSIPLVIGHEFSGRVVEVGKDVRRLKLDDRVAVHCVDSCGNCYYCRQSKYVLCPTSATIGFNRDGGFGEWVVVPEDCCYRLADGVSYLAGALVEPLSVAMHAVHQAQPDLGARVAVVGGGTVGLCVVQALRATGASQIFVVEIAQAKKALALELGASAFINPLKENAAEAIQELTDGRGADVTFECVGIDATLNTSLQVTRPGGKICVVGVFAAPTSFNFNDLLKHEKALVTTIAYGDEFPTVIAMLADGRIKAEPMITRTVTLPDAIEKGIRQYEEVAATGVKTLIQVDGS